MNNVLPNEHIWGPKKGYQYLSCLIFFFLVDYYSQKDTL